MDTSRNYAGQDYHVPTAETTNAHASANVSLAAIDSLLHDHLW